MAANREWAREDRQHVVSSLSGARAYSRRMCRTTTREGYVTAPRPQLRGQVPRDQMSLQDRAQAAAQEEPKRRAVAENALLERYVRGVLELDQDTPLYLEQQPSQGSGGVGGGVWDFTIDGLRFIAFVGSDGDCYVRLRVISPGT
jgi:hypothetical protein